MNENQSKNINDARLKVKTRLGFDPYEKYPFEIAGSGQILNDLKKCFDLLVEVVSNSDRVFFDFGFAKYEISKLFAIYADNPKINILLEVNTNPLTDNHLKEVSRIMALMVMAGFRVTSPKNHIINSSSSFLARTSNSDIEIKEQISIINNLINKEFIIQQASKEDLPGNIIKGQSGIN